MSTPDLTESTLLGGRYRLVEELGAGGMAVVWRGFDEVLGRQVAVKVLSPAPQDDAGLRRRLRIEAQAAARLSHPHVTNVYDYGEHTGDPGEAVPYVVMELVDGEALSSVLSRVTRLPWPLAVRTCAEVAAALSAAHARGIVHRDVTPNNVMLTESGAKVVDFGISAVVGESDIDPDGSLLGTPAYLAPERLDGGQVSPAADVYALGVLLYRTMTGTLPWDVGTTTALLQAHQYTEPEPLPLVPGLPSGVADICHRCLAKRPDQRPTSAEVADALAAVAAGTSVAQIPLLAAACGVRGAADTTILPRTPVAGPWPAPAAAPVAAVRAAALGHPAGADLADAQDQAGADPAAGTTAASGPAAADPAAGTPPAVESPAAGGIAAFSSDPAGPPDRPRQAGPASPAPAPRRRARRRAAVVATVGLLALGGAGYGWRAWDGLGARPEKAQAAGPGGVAAPGCTVTYEIRRDDGREFEAALMVTNTGAGAMTGWQLRFAMPGDQRVTGQGAATVRQAGRLVTAESPKGIPAAASVRLLLSGRYAKSNAPPAQFRLNDGACDLLLSDRPGAAPRRVPQPQSVDGGTEVGGPAVVPAVDAGQPTVSTVPAQPGGGGTAGPEPTTPEPTAPVDPAPTTGTPTPTPQPTEGGKGNGKGNGNGNGKGNGKGKGKDEGLLATTAEWLDDLL